MRKIWIGIIIFIFLLVVTLFFGKTTTELQGTFMENGVPRKVEIVVKRRIIDGFINALKGEVIITDEGSSIVYESSNRVFPTSYESCKIVDIIGYDDAFVFGRMFFDIDLENVVIIIDDKQIDAASQTFVENVQRIIQ